MLIRVNAKTQRGEAATKVAQTSKSAVSRVSRPAADSSANALPTWKSAIQQVWKPAPRWCRPASAPRPKLFGMRRTRAIAQRRCEGAGQPDWRHTILDCGGKRSATPLGDSEPQRESGITAPLCHRSPRPSFRLCPGASASLLGCVGNQVRTKRRRNTSIKLYA